MFQRQFVSELRRCEEMERQLSKCHLLYIFMYSLLRPRVEFATLHVCLRVVTFTTELAVVTYASMVFRWKIVSF